VTQFVLIIKQPVIRAGMSNEWVLYVARICMDV